MCTYLYGKESTEYTPVSEIVYAYGSSIYNSGTPNMSSAMAVIFLKNNTEKELLFRYIRVV